MPVKLLYHYLIGVKGFKLGYHTSTNIKEGSFSEVKHEYMLFKKTANIKLTESIPEHEDELTMYHFGVEKNLYPDKRKLSYYGADMSFICDSDKPYPEYDWHNGPTSQSSYDENGTDIIIDARNGLFELYNKFEEAGCISDEWRLGEFNDLHGMTSYSLIPNELALISCRLQSEKENVTYNHVMMNTHGNWSAFNTDGWMKAVALAVSTQYYTPELKQAIESILTNYQALYLKKLGDMIDNLGARDSLEAMKWSKEALKKVMQGIVLIKSDGTLQKSDTAIVDQMERLFTFKRNNYDLPDWLQIYLPETIQSLGGVELLQHAIKTRGENFCKESIPILAEAIECERKDMLHKQNQKFVISNDLISDQLQDNSEVITRNTGIKK